MSNTTRRRGHFRRTLALGLPALLLLIALPAAQADLCGDCRPPTLAELQAAPGFRLDWRTNDSGYGVQDFAIVSGGSCRVSLTGEPEVEKISSYLVVRARGVCQSCPYLTSNSEMVARTVESDITEWSLSGTVSVGGTLLGVNLKAEVTALAREEIRVSVVTEHRQTYRAGRCHIVPWDGMFEIADLKTTADVSLNRSWNWWTKNVTTDDVVHASGACVAACGVGNAVLTRRAPLTAYFHLGSYACPDPECHATVPVAARFVPPLPRGLAPPSGWSPRQPSDLIDNAPESGEPDCECGK